MTILRKHPLPSLATLLGSVLCLSPQPLLALGQAEPTALTSFALNNIFLALCFLAGLIILTGVQLRSRITYKRTVLACQASEERFRSFFESSAAAIGIATPQGDYLQVNPTSCQLLGYSEAELLGRNVLDVTHPDDRAITRQQLEELISGARQVIDYEKRYLHRDGSTLWGHCIASCVRDASGIPVYIAGQIVDISARKQAEAALQASNRQLQAIIDFLPDATLVIDRQKRVIAWNRAMEEKTGVRKEEILGQGDHAYALALYGERKPILIDLVCDAEPGSLTDYDFIDKRGETLFAERFLPTINNGLGAHIWMKASPLLDQDGKMIGAIESIRDISQRKRAEEELRKANHELDAFAHTVSHDLRSPLTPIIGFADFLHEKYRHQLDETALKSLSNISTAGHKMLATMNDLLALATVGRVERPSQPLDTTVLVEQLIKERAAQLERSGVKIHLAPLPRLRISDSLLIPLFDNLLGNAILYAAGSGKSIEVGGARQGDLVTLFVRDHGPGIPVADRERIFETFYRGSTSAGHEGSGIGLATVQKIANQYNGKAWVEETPGGGSTFHVELLDSQPDIEEVQS